MPATMLPEHGKKTLTFKAKAPPSDGVYRWTISTDTVDSDREVMVPSGCNAKAFLKRGGPMYWQHNTTEYPIASVREIVRGESDIEASIVFPPKPEDYDGDWESAEMKALVDAGLVAAVSVGFSRVEGGQRMATDSDRKKYGDTCEIVTNKWVLEEVSFTGTPANPEALRKCVKSGAVSRAAAKRWFSIEVPAASTHRIQIVVPKYGQAGLIEKACRDAIAKKRGRIYN